MNKSRLLAILVMLQLISLLTITQSWYQVSMSINDKQTSLGEFDGVASYPLAMTLALFCLAALAVAALSRNKRWGVAVASLVNLVLAFWLIIQVSQRNISALDSQLDRLTGIAKTHGLDSVSVELTIYPWLSIIVFLLIAALGTYLAASKWPASSAKYSASSRAKSESPSDAIGIWDQQRP